MENENPAIAIGGMTALAKYAPAAHQDLFEEMHYLAQWVSKKDEIEALSADGYWPLALFIHRLVSKQLVKELEGVQQALDELIEMDSTEWIGNESAMTYARDLHKLRHKRLEEFGVVISNVKAAIKEKRLIVRYGSPPYFPVEDSGQFGFGAWLENRKERPGKVWERYPDGRLVIKISEAEAWLDSIGVATPKSIGPAESKSERRIRQGDRSNMEKIIGAIKDLGYDQKKLADYGRVRSKVINRALQLYAKSNLKRSMLEKAWQLLRDIGEIAD